MPSKHANKEGKRDRVPVALVIPHVQEWAKRSDDGLPPADLLAERIGMERSMCEKMIHGRYDCPYVRFDVADRIFCALGDPIRYWRSTEETHAFYEKASRGADRIQVDITEEKREKRRAYYAANRERYQAHKRRYRARKRAEAA